MDITRLGRTGLEVSRICFGCMSFGKATENRPWVLGLEEARPLYRRAWEAGINFFDTANVYAEGTSEEITGKLLKELAPREEIVLASKVNRPMRPGPNGKGNSRKAILGEIDNSSAASAPTISTSTRSTASTRTCRWRRPWRRCMTW